jgi:hypothetical protein
MISRKEKLYGNREKLQARMPHGDFEFNRISGLKNVIFGGGEMGKICFSTKK